MSAAVCLGIGVQAAPTAASGELLEMIDDLPARSLVTADAGFIGYEYWMLCRKPLIRS